MSDFRYIPRSALVGPSASGRIPDHWLKGQAPGRRGTFDEAPLAQFVLLSILLHALAITLFGAPTGGSREGRAMWGTLNVLLLGPVREIVLPPVPAPLPRVVPPKPKPVPPPPPTPAPKETLPVEAAPTQAPLSFPPLLDRIPTPDTTTIPELKVPAPIEAPVSIPSQIEKVEPSAPKLEMAPAVELPPIREAPPPVPAPLPLPAPPPAPIPVERAPVETPALPTPPPPVVTPPVERAPIEAPPLPVPPIATPPVAKPPIEVPPLPVPAPTTVAPRVEPPPVAAPQVQPAETAVVPATPPAVERLEPPAPIREVPAKRESELPKTEPTPRFTAPLPGPSESPFRAAPKKPDASKDDYDPTAPSIDMEAVRKRAGALAREGTGNRALLPFPMPPKPEHKTKEQIAIENARKPDCKSAYASLGLAAIIPLIANEFGEGTCRW